MTSVFRRVIRARGDVLFTGVLLLALGCLANGLPKLYADVDVYRLGALTLLEGKSIYHDLPVSAIGGPLPYTYPPSSAVLFVPLALVPTWLGYPLLTAASAFALVPLVTAYRAAAPELRTLLDRSWLVVAAAIALLLGHPVANTIYWGQINVLLMTMVALDVLLPRTPWPRGLLLGLAAAIKLTPAGFALIFLLRKDRRALLTSIASFAAATVLAFVIAPSDSLFYWTDRVFNATSMRIGGPLANESVVASLEKLGMTGVSLSLVAALLAVAVLAGTWFGTRAALAGGDLVMALGTTAAGVLLLSPISWSHHWVLALPTAAIVLLRGYQRHHAPLLLSGWLAVVILWLAPHYSLPAVEQWDVLDDIIGSSYQLLALALLTVMSVRWFRRGTPPTVTQRDFEAVA
ncbi:membrane protein [Amycolatopsis taiwanensis]|uniref:Membrane protein n=1 Tax=Amycolatopsis taiwanensis TaxID=342230 RepID=A0A9W6R4A6_9PSEU|nr:membrane protein [Amycolatopsis taiwanensis]